jgi:hypothetical protein
VPSSHTIPVYFFRTIRYGYNNQLVYIHRSSKNSVFIQKDYLTQVLKPYMKGFLVAFGAVLGTSKTLQFIENKNSAYSCKLAE